MADLNNVITLGIGTPASIKHFILFGLNTAATTIGTLSASIYTGPAMSANMTATSAISGNIDVER